MFDSGLILLVITASLGFSGILGSISILVMAVELCSKD